jgi:hypothetical protein
MLDARIRAVNAEVVVAARSVARHSYRYWTEHVDAWRQAIIGTLPEADSTVTRDATGPQTNAPADCSPRKLEKVKVIDTPDGKITVKVYSCGDDAETGMNWEGMAVVSGADVASGAAALPTGAGSVGAALITSAGTAGAMILDRLIDTPEN